MQWEGSVYPKGRKWWVRHKRLGGQEWANTPTDFYLAEPDGREKAAALLTHMRELWYAHDRAAGEDGAPLTVEAWGKRWIEKRRRQGIDSAREEEQRLRDHVYPSIGHVLLPDVRRSHARAVMEAVQEKPRKTRAKDAPPERLAPRTVLHVYRTARQMFKAAVRAELIAGNPFDLDRDELPKKRDKDPTWRADAVCSVAEVEQLISDPRIPEDRRLLYSLEFLTGSRSGEAAAVRWRRWERDLQPLGRITIARAYNTRRKIEKEPKTGRVRQVPVHPTLAKILAGWKLAGFERYTGRKPTDEDLIVPSATGRHRNVGYSLKCFHHDLEQLGLRRRRHYDSRRTFKSMATNHGATDDLMKWITHTPGNVLDGYTSPSWSALCEAVLCVPAKLRGRARVARLR